MSHEVRHRSFFLLRALEWNDPKAKYPNRWAEGLPAHVLAYDTVAGRLRLGDLVAVYHPASTKHVLRSERFVGIVRVAGLRRSDRDDLCWVDLEPVHRFDPPLDAGRAPRRVFLCCDDGWPDEDRDLFATVYRAAVDAGWRPGPHETFEPPPATTPATSAAPAEPPARPDADVPGRRFGGLSWSGDRRDPREDTWIAVARLADDGGLEIERLDAVGREGAVRALSADDAPLRRAEAIGCAFPFGLPAPFVEGSIEVAEDAGWWAVGEALRSIGYVEFLTRVKAYHEADGEPLRRTDRAAGVPSALDREGVDRASQAFHGLRALAVVRSHFAVRPFEQAAGVPLLEVDPAASARDVAAPRSSTGDAWVEVLEAASDRPVRLAGALRARCAGSRHALAAVLAARAAARAVLTGEVDRTAGDLAPDAPDRVLREGWVYGAVPAT